VWHGGGGADEIHLEGEWHALRHARQANYWLEGVGVTGAGGALAVVQKTMRIPAMVVVVVVVVVVVPSGKRPTM